MLGAELIRLAGVRKAVLVYPGSLTIARLVMTASVGRVTLAAVLLMPSRCQHSRSISASGVIESTAGGFKFPGGTVQTTAATVPTTVRFSILAETMSPIDSTIGFDSFDANLETTSDSTIHGTAAYVAQINLPDGAMIEDATCYGFDTAPEAFGLAVYRYRFNGDLEAPFTAVTPFGLSSGMPGAADITVQVIDPPPPDKPGLAVVNNEDFSYGLFLQLPLATSGKLYVVRCVVRSTLG